MKSILTSRKKVVAITLAAIVGVMTLGACMLWHGEHEDEDKIPLSQVPNAVRMTVEREAKGSKVDGVEKSEDVKGAYEADITVDGKAYDITIAADGTVVKRELEKKGEKD